ncbi:hypothetical protein [Microbulbifer celer]|uniref:hypothetical protein n=1 Tax=Microbulbifer celer TaxID=435905 RepID=UPI001E427317|nr:hypothetical protein [Microbulbifer celer]UFN55871.1 hypothetical protein LPW13_09785 [Microbulbifer celer]UFN56854.1 hypothetical protein LPW13_14955 [Microbulbifer celer]
METIECVPINVFKKSFGPILTLLNENNVKYRITENRSGAVMASSGAIDVIVNASMWVSLASVIIAFLKVKNSREIIIQTKDKKVIHAKGLDSKQLEKILKSAENITAIDPGT